MNLATYTPIQFESDAKLVNIPRPSGANDHTAKPSAQENARR